MPDIVAVRPLGGASIESAWGGEVHDAIEGIQAGSASVVVSAAAFGQLAVTFPRPYTVAPRVFLSIQSTPSPAAVHAWIPSAGVTATGFTVAAGRDDASTLSGTIVVVWLAIGTPVPG